MQMPILACLLTHVDLHGVMMHMHAILGPIHTYLRVLFNLLSKIVHNRATFQAPLHAFLSPTNARREPASTYRMFG